MVNFNDTKEVQDEINDIRNKLLCIPVWPGGKNEKKKLDILRRLDIKEKQLPNNKNETK